MYYIDYSLNTNYMIRNALKAANALTFSTMLPVTPRRMQQEHDYF